MTDLRVRIDAAIARVKAARAADEVLAEIAKTHRICAPAEITVAALGDLIIHAVDSTTATGAIRKCEVASAFVVGLRSLGLMLVDVEQRRGE